MKFSIIIPCYNESKNMEYLLSRLIPLQKKYDLEYVLVENGSKDNSRNYFKKYVDGKYPDIRVVYVDDNRGYGYGLQQGIIVATGDYIGWIHADLQVPPDKLRVFFDEVNKNPGNKKIFFKGRRINRRAFDRFFTNGQSLFNTILFHVRLYDIGAIPVLFHRSLIKNVDKMPNDFSIELYIYKEAVQKGYKIKRFPVRLMRREKGNSSWNHGFYSKICQSKVIFLDSIKIKRGKKVI